MRTVKSAMPLNVLIVTDKFKGTLTAQTAADLIARGWREARPEDSLELLPMSDGGDGFGEVLGGLLKIEERTIAMHESRKRPRVLRFRNRRVHWYQPPIGDGVENVRNVVRSDAPRPSWFREVY